MRQVLFWTESDPGDIFESFYVSWKMDKKVRAQVVIAGKVQGVFFRMETKRTADTYGVCGWVKNKNDGTVEALLEGDEERVRSVIDWCREGPPFAKVRRVDVTWGDYTGRINSFDITY
jgi:acylphosphatase